MTMTRQQRRAIERAYRKEMKSQLAAGVLAAKRPKGFGYDLDYRGVNYSGEVRYAPERESDLEPVTVNGWFNPTADFVAPQFDHFTSRDAEPHLMTHHALWNAVGRGA